MLALAASTALLTEIGLNSRNTLDHHPEWFLGKGLMQRAPVGAGEARIYRNLLAGNRLNLGAFHGFQEVLTVRPLVLGGAAFRFRLAPKAYLDVIISKTSDGSTGVRLGQTSFFFTTDDSGGYVSHVMLPLRPGPGWHRCDLSRAYVSLDGGSPVDLPLTTAAPGLFGFRGSLADVEVDEVELYEGGRRVLRESFRNDRHYVAVLLECFGLVAVSVGVVFLASRRERGLRTVALLLLTGVVLALYWACDYFVLARSYLSYYRLEQLRMRVVQRLFGGVDPLPSLDLRETMRFLNAPPEARPSDYRLTARREGKSYLFPDTAEGIAQYRQAHPQPPLCVVFLGTSQTWGEGAYRLDETLVNYAGDALQSTEVINAARRGSNSVELVYRYFDHLYHLKPDLIVVNLGNNDLSADVLAQSLGKLAHLPLLLSLEANSPEAPYDELKAKHDAMRATGLPVADLHAFLAKQQSGLIWWDKVHLTSYGQELAGEFLALEISRRLVTPRR